MKNIENNEQKPQLSSYQSKNWSSSKKTESVPYYHITRATTITTNNNTRPVKYKTSKNVIKKVNFNIDISDIYMLANLPFEYKRSQLEQSITD